MRQLSIKRGEKTNLSIQKAVNQTNFALILVSENTTNETNSLFWTEYNLIINKSDQFSNEHIFIIPIILNKGISSPFEIREIYPIHFTKNDEEAWLKNRADLKTSLATTKSEIPDTKQPVIIQDTASVDHGNKPNAPIVFISYSWDSEKHKEWVLGLTNKLIKNGVDVILDQYELGIGGNLTYFVEDAIRRSDYVLLILTENYKLKTEGRKGGVGYEYSIINNKLYDNQRENKKFLPILRSGNKINSVPDFLQSFIFLDMSDNKTFEARYTRLLREIHKEPNVKKPPRGNRPNF